MITERFAPSPTGFLHLGHAYSALLAFDSARHVDGQFHLRIEDIDTARCKPEYLDAIYEDLSWLGMSWEHPEMVQSNRVDAYEMAKRHLRDMGLIYPCSCSRKDVTNALSAPQEGDQAKSGPDGIVYPGTCRERGMGSRAEGDAIRLNMAAAVKAAGDLDRLGYSEIGLEAGWKPLRAEYLIENCGDVVLARRDIGTSYHLAVVVDDADQGVTHVTRGHDMAASTPIHVLLQHLLDLPHPTYRHHRLVRDKNGKRLAKRHDDLALWQLRKQGWTPADIRANLRVRA